MSEWSGHLEPLTELLRVFKKEQKYGDPYEWCCTIRYLTSSSIELCGVMSFPELSLRHAIAKTLYKRGVRRAVIRRYKNGRMREIVIYADENKKLHILDSHRDSGDSRLTM